MLVLTGQRQVRSFHLRTIQLRNALVFVLYMSDMCIEQCVGCMSDRAVWKPSEGVDS